MFRRRRAVDPSSEPDEWSDADDYPDDEAEYADDEAEDDEDGYAGENVDYPARSAAPVREQAATTGPWDVEDLPEDDEVPRLDLGGIVIPIPDGMELRVEVQDDMPVAAVLVDGNSQLQLHAFAAPKSAGLWAEVREEITGSLRSTGGSAEETDGPFGTELRARLPQEGGAAPVPARFLGVDGPRWFLRGLLSGPAATDPGRARALEEAFRAVVVVRGGEAMAPRDLLPMHLPREAVEAPAPGPEPSRRVELPQRGPEITETR